MPAPLKDSRIVVTLDGLAGSGKSSLAAGLAQKLRFINFNSGLLYRCIGYLALNENVSPNDEGALVQMIARHSIRLVDAGDHNIAVALDGKIMTEGLRTPEVSEATSRSSRFHGVRALLLELQRQACPGRNLVAEGRDMGTIVFPKAQVKYFVEASVDVRVARRLKQLGLQDSAASHADLEKQIAQEIIDRDKRDAERLVAPTVAAEGSINIDNSSAPLDVTVAKMAALVIERCQIRQRSTSRDL